MKIIGVGTLVAAMVAFAGVTGEKIAHAQDDMGNQDGSGRQLDPRPEPPRPVLNDGDRPPVRRQAGVGGEIAFAEAGVLELGGAAGFTLASDFTSFELAPSIGYFLANNVQLSLLTGVNYIEAGDVDSTFAKLLLEPSYHLPFTDAVFGFLGVGFGGTYAKDVDFGFAVAPRLGAKIMVGRSGILSPAITWLYSTNDLATGGTPGPGDSSVTTATVSSAFSFNVGYTVMW